MSTEAWSDYEVPGSPFFVLVDGRSGRRIGEGVANHFSQVVELVRRAESDARAFFGGRRHRPGARRLGDRRASTAPARGSWTTTGSSSRPASSPATRASTPHRSTGSTVRRSGPARIARAGRHRPHADQPGPADHAACSGPTASPRPCPPGSRVASSSARPSDREVPYPVANFATFALPAEVGDFGSGAVNLMGTVRHLRHPLRVRPREPGQAASSPARACPGPCPPTTSVPTCSAADSAASRGPSGSSPRPDGRSPSTWCWAATSSAACWSPGSTTSSAPCRSS